MKLPFGLCALVLLSCAPAQPPPTRELVHLRGSPYERGLQHGTLLRSKVRSFYTTLLTNSLLPYLSREQPDIASLLSEYSQDRYQNGHFAYEMLLDSAHSLEHSLPHAVRDELQGIADGSGLTYEQILVLNTFVDSVLAVRGVALAIRLARAPHLTSVEVLGADADGVDNDGDGVVDNAGEGTLSPYVTPYLPLGLEFSPSASFRFTLLDPDGVDPRSVRVRLGDALFVQGSPELTFEEVDLKTLRITFTPSAPLPLGSTQTLVLSAGDALVIGKPPPDHESFMRDEELFFTVRGAGLTLNQVRRPRLYDGRTRPPSVALALRGTATTDGEVLLAQSFALLDANTSHRHGVVLVHHPDNGPPFVTVGWAGLAYGFSGMSASGVAYACDPSDTLDNSVVGSVVAQIADISKAKLLATGSPIGFVGRKLLETATDVASARDVMVTAHHAYGWSCVIADRAGGLAAVEVDSDIFKEGSYGAYPFVPGDADPSGRLYGSVGLDDLELASAYSRNVADIATLNLAGQKVQPERSWSGFYFRSRRAADGLARRVEGQYGQWDSAALEALLGDDEFVDHSDSMNAAVFDVSALKVRSAMGTEPATDSPFETFDLGAEVAP